MCNKCEISNNIENRYKRLLAENKELITELNMAKNQINSTTRHHACEYINEKYQMLLKENVQLKKELKALKN